jgi:hypothetical protein
LAPFVPHAFYPVFYLFPVTFESARMATDAVNLNPDYVTRWMGLSWTCCGLASLMLARYGARGIFGWRTLGRQLVFAALAFGTIFGGFRSMLLQLVLTLGIVFYIEGLLTTRRLPLLVLGGVLGATLVVLFANRMPLNVQRSLSVVPGLDLNPLAVRNAEASSAWRLEMWQDVLPEVPQYLILGKGLGINPAEMASLQMSEGFGNVEGGLAGTELVGDYHNGPLSVIIPFGLFGVAGFAWFVIAVWKVLSRNFRYGDPSLQNINRLLFAFFVAKLFMFLFVTGGFGADLQLFVGFVGLSISLNGGVEARPIVARTKAAPVRLRPDSLLGRPVAA